MNLVRAGENLRFPKNFPWPLFRFGLKSPCNSNRFYQAWWALNGISKLSKISDHWSPSDQQPKNSHILKEDQDWQKHDGGEIQTDWDICSHWCVGPATGTLLRGMDSLIDMPGPATGKWGIFYFGEPFGPATEEFPHSQGGSRLTKTRWGWNPNGLRYLLSLVRRTSNRHAVERDGFPHRYARTSNRQVGDFLFRGGFRTSNRRIPTFSRRIKTAKNTMRVKSKRIERDIWCRSNRLLRLHQIYREGDYNSRTGGRQTQKIFRLNSSSEDKNGN